MPPLANFQVACYVDVVEVTPIYPHQGTDPTLKRERDNLRRCECSTSSRFLRFSL